MPHKLDLNLTPAQKQALKNLLREGNWAYTNGKLHIGADKPIIVNSNCTHQDMEVTMAQVWHAKTPTFGLSEQNFPTDYELVAEVPSDNLEVIFERTNTIECPWWENEGVFAIAKKIPCRSTSVGDVVIMNDEKWLCGALGWKLL